MLKMCDNNRCCDHHNYVSACSKITKINFAFRSIIIDSYDQSEQLQNLAIPSLKNV